MHALHFRTSLLTAVLISFALCRDVYISPTTPGGLSLATKMAPAGSTIILSPGRYVGTDNRNVTLSKPLTIQSAIGESAETTIVDCEGVSRCLTVTSAASGSRLHRVAFVNGAVGSPPPMSRSGPATHQNDSRNEPQTLLRKGNTSQTRVSNSYTAKSVLELSIALSQLTQEDAARALLRWLSLSGAASIISALPEELLGHHALRTQVLAWNQEATTGAEPWSNATLLSQPTEIQARATEDCDPAPVDSPNGCSGVTTLVASCGFLTDGSADYLAHADCGWVIDPPNAETLYVSFVFLDIELASDCRYDYLSLSEGRPENGGRRELGRFCGHFSQVSCFGDNCGSLDLNAMVVRPPLTLALTSDYAQQFAGFELTWSVSPFTTATVEPGGCLLVLGAGITLDAIHVRSGFAANGGGLAVVNGTVSIQRSEFSDNMARLGGAIFGSDSSIWIEGSRLARNKAFGKCSKSVTTSPDVAGAGLFLLSSNIVLKDSELRGNTAQSEARTCPDIIVAGTLAAIDCDVRLESTDIEQNTCVSVGQVHGGALFFDGCNVSASSCQVNNNSVTGTSSAIGAGLYCRKSNVLMSFCNLSFNTASGMVAAGGGAWTERSTVSLLSSDVMFNALQGGDRGVAQGGGCAFVAGNVSVFSCRVFSNAAVGSEALGTGIYVESGQGIIHKSHLSSNAASGLGLRDPNVAGGGIYSLRANLTVSSTHVVFNYLNASPSTEVSGDAAGGGIFGTWNLFVSNSTVNRNSLYGARCLGGGIFFVPETNGEVLVATRSDVSNNALLADPHVLSFAQTYGGGIYVGPRSPTITARAGLFFLLQCHVNSNHMDGASTAEGGGLWFSGGSCSVDASQLNFNHASGTLMNGGGLYVVGNIVSMSSSNITFNTMRCSNHAYSTCKGGGVFFQDAKTSIVEPLRSIVNISFCSVAFNSVSAMAASLGGGIYGSRCHLFVVSSRVNSNTLSTSADGFGAGSHGGGLYVILGNVSVSSSRVSDNHLVSKMLGSGGGILIRAGHLRVSSSEIRRNNLTSPHSWGGGIFSGFEPSAGGDEPSHISLSFSSVSNNKLIAPSALIESQANGGGIYAEGKEESPVRITIVSSLLVNNTMRAASGLGGAICVVSYYQTAVSFVSILFVASSRLSSNRAYGAKISGGGALWLQSSRCVVHQCELLRNDINGGVCAGGVGYFHSSWVHMLRSKLQSNRVFGTSSAEGGALWLQAGSLQLEHCDLLENVATQGGAIVAQGGVVGSVMDSKILRNRAFGLGGGMNLRGGVSMRIDRVQMTDNKALLVSDIFAVGSGLFLHTFNSSFHSVAPYPALVQGASLRLHNSTTWASAMRGAAYVLESTELSEIIRFVVCPVGSYLLRESTSVSRLNCSDCPTGAYCAGGAVVYALRSHWGWLTLTSELTMARCPEGYCCPHARCLSYNYCQGHRDGALCGRCKDGFSEALGTAGCLQNSECNHVSWLVPCALFSTGLVMLCLVVVRWKRARELATRPLEKRDKEGSDGGEIEVLVFFFQIVPEVMSLATREAMSLFGQALFSMFNLQLSSGGDSSGICPYQGFSAIQKIASSAVVPLLCYSWILVFSLANKLFKKLGPTHGDLNRRHQVRVAGIMGALFDMLILGYSTLVRTAFTLLSCLSLQDKSVLFLAAETECYQVWQIALICIAMPLLWGFPALLAMLVRREALQRAHERHGCVRSLSLRTVVDVIARPFDNERALTHQWEAMLMFERLVVIIVSGFVSHPVWRAWALVIIASVLLTLQLWVQPFKRRGPNSLMTLSIVVIVLIGAWEVAAAVYVDEALDIPKMTATSFAIISAVIVVTPLCLAACIVLSAPSRSLWSRWRYGSGRTSETNLELVAQGDLYDPSTDGPLDDEAPMQTSGACSEVDVSTTAWC